MNQFRFALPALLGGALLLTALGAAAQAAQRVALSSASDTIRVKDLGRLQGWRENALVGYGIVTGLAGTGDSPGNVTAVPFIAPRSVRTTSQSLARISAWVRET